MKPKQCLKSPIVAVTTGTRIFYVDQTQEIGIKLYKNNIQFQGKTQLSAHNFKLFINGEYMTKIDAKNNCLPSISFPFATILHNCYFSISFFFPTLQQRDSYFDFNFQSPFLLISWFDMQRNAIVQIKLIKLFPALLIAN